MNRYVPESEVSRLTGLAVQTLRNHRHQKRGIPYVKMTSKAVRYSLDDVITYMEARKITPEG
jgi:predicted DNA-binding transcriptional regulator AlpA